MTYEVGVYIILILQMRYLVSIKESKRICWSPNPPSGSGDPILDILSEKDGDDEGATNTRCSETHALVHLYINPLRKSHPSHLQMISGRSEPYPGWASHQRTQDSSSGSMVSLYNEAFRLSLALMEKGHMMKFIKQLKKALYKSSWNTLQGLGDLW